MKKDNRGFFLSETIVVISLVTIVIAFMYPNTAKLYDNYKNQAYMYDQTKDIYLLKAIYEKEKDNLKKDKNSLIYCKECDNTVTKIKEIDNKQDENLNLSIPEIERLYVVGYMDDNLSSDNYNFNKYLKRMKKSVYSPLSYRLIGIFKSVDEKNYRFASIKMDF